MKIILSQTLCVMHQKFVFARITKEFESNVIPRVGDKITDSLWKDPYDYKAFDIIINYSEDICEVTLEKYATELTDLNDLKEMIKIAELHNWKCNTLSEK